MPFVKLDNPRNAMLPAIRVRPDELETVRNAALLAKQTVAEYVRSKLFANPAPDARQSEPIPALQSESSALDTLLLSQSPSASPAKASNLANESPASEPEKFAGRASIHSKRAGECAHGFRIRNGLTACGECKRK